MATKTATVQSGQTAGTNTNFPAYVDLADVGVTTLAEAQSIRVYSDAGLTTELAREIVSVTEMHVKIPSMTSSTQIWIDYDGVRADYAVGATYGRNAVWSDYDAVWHFESDASDSTGNIATGTASGASINPEKIGNGYDFDGVNDSLNLNRVTGLEGQTKVNHQMWHRSDLGTDMFLWGNPSFGSANNWQAYYEASPVTVFFAVRSINNRFVYPVTNMTSEQLHKWDIVYDGALSGNANRFKLFQDGSNVTANGSFVGTIEATSTTATGALTLGLFVPGSSFDLDGAFDEMRIRSGDSLSADWITTEYNNQNDNAAFWGTWTTAGGGVTANNSARRMLLMQM